MQDWCCIIASGYPFGCISEYTLETMIGTIVNATTIIVGGIIGSLLHRGVKEKYKEVLYTGLGLASLAIGLNATISHFSQSQYPVLFCWQGMFWLVAHISSTAVSDALMAELLIVGGLLITGSGLSLLNLKDCKTLNLLPALLVPVVWFLICSIISV